MSANKPILKAVKTMTPVEGPDSVTVDPEVLEHLRIGADGKVVVEAVPLVPALDEAAEYRSDQLAKLDDTNAKLHAVQSTIIAQQANFDREQERLAEKRRATMDELHARERALTAVAAGCEAALAATEPKEG